MTISKEEALAGLHEAARLRAEAAAAMDRASDMSRLAAHAARGVVPVAQIARIMGVQRQAVYAWLNAES